jgi:hypothetical protein
MAWPATEVATGDLVTAAQLNQLPIALAKVSGAGATLTFTSIPQFWTHLLIVACVQSGSGNNSDPLKVTFNGDAGANYSRLRWRASNGADDFAQNAAANYIDAGECPGKATGGFCSSNIWVQNYTIAQPHQVYASGYACWDVAVSASQILWTNGGTYKPSVAAAITSIALTPGAGSFVADSVAMLYGMGAF